MVIEFKDLIDDSASFDNVRLYDVTSDVKHGVPPFLIIPGHQSGKISSICKFQSQWTS
jgi:hypothetical protein